VQIERIGDAKLITSDNVTALKQFPDDFVDLTVTSPPYDNLRTYNGFAWDFESLAKELYRVTKPGGVVVWNVNDATVNGSETLTSFRQALFFKDVCGFRVHDTMLFHKQNYVPLTHNRYEQCFEYVFILSKGKPKTFNPIMVDSLQAGKKVDRKNTNRAKEGSTRCRDQATIIKDKKISPNLFSYIVGHKTDNGNHTAAFPEEFATDHILSWSNEGDVVLDPFMGSGTTGKMALLNNRKFIGIELSPEYVEIARKRIQECTK